MLEFAVPVWNSSLTQKQIKQIERVQFCAVTIIKGQNFKSHSQASTSVGLSLLSQRRELICTKFAIKSYSDVKYQHWFEYNNTNKNDTRNKRSLLKPVVTRKFVQIILQLVI